MSERGRKEGGAEMGTNEDDIMYKMNDEVAGLVVKRDFLQFLNT